MARRFSDSSTERRRKSQPHHHKETFPPFIFIHSTEVEEEDAVLRIHTMKSTFSLSFFRRLVTQIEQLEREKKRNSSSFSEGFDLGVRERTRESSTVPLEILRSIPLIARPHFDLFVLG